MQEVSGVCTSVLVNCKWLCGQENLRGLSRNGHLAGDIVLFLGKILYSHSASLHPGVCMGTGEFNDMLGITLRWTSIPSREE